MNVNMKDKSFVINGLTHPRPSSSIGYHTQYYEFTGVSSCWDVIHLHRLLWASVVLNVSGLVVGIITAAILGAYKDIVSPEKNKQLIKGPLHPVVN